jgi:hypothetical protein
MGKRLGLISFAFILGSGLLLIPAKAQKRHNLPARLLTAKLVYFENQTGYAAVGDESVRELEKWGRFQMVQSRDQADLVLVLSSKIESEGVASPTEDRRFGPDLSFHFRYRPANAYLTVDDAVTGERLWSGRHVWGGLLTGFNSAGRRLIHKLRKQVER